MKKATIIKESLASELAGLSGFDRAALLEQWQHYYRTSPPAKISHQLLIYAIGYRMQELVLGGLKPTTRRMLDKAADTSVSAVQIAAQPQAIKAGTRLLREWHGVTHEVIIETNGVCWNGKKYKSLSEVARHITGARWSGPLFFGLKNEARNG